MEVIQPGVSTFPRRGSRIRVRLYFEIEALTRLDLRVEVQAKAVFRRPPKHGLVTDDCTGNFRENAEGEVQSGGNVKAKSRTSCTASCICSMSVATSMAHEHPSEEEEQQQQQ